MKNYLLLKYLITTLKGYIFIFLTATIFLFVSFTKSFGEENVFTINEVKVEGIIDLNFSRDKYLNRAFQDSFQILMNRILLTRDLKKIGDIKLNKIKNLIRGFQIAEESYRKDKYKATIKIFYNESEVKNFLRKRNISFSQPENISAVFYPVLYINDQIQNFSENFFYKNWEKIKVKNELINFVLPIEDLEDISKLTKMRSNTEAIDVEVLVSKYDIKNYVFALMDYRNEKLNIYLKTNFKNNEVSKNIFYDVKDIKNDLILNFVLKDFKTKITDLWKEENLINLLMPLSINLKFQHKNLKNLDKLKNIFYKISIIDNFTLEEFNINNSFFEIYYYGNPKKLKSELSKFGYQLENVEGIWQLYLNE